VSWARRTLLARFAVSKAFTCDMPGGPQLLLDPEFSMTPVALPRVESPRFPSLSRPLARRSLPGAKPAPFPSFIQPCLALARTEVPSARGLVHELKLDGYRVQAHISDGRVRLYTRGGFEWTSRFATIVANMTRIPAGKLVQRVAR
jgi:ATP-dependent DNA ligase